MARWEAPPVGSIKLNCDAAVRANRFCIREGVVVRNYSGQVVVTSSKILSCSFSPELGEFLALRDGLALAIQHGLNIAWCESDATNVVAAVNGVSDSFCEAGPVISDIKAFCNCWHFFMLGYF
ncbi:hypothetical protein ACOSQ2_011001 [Xanthoceras sorbifolium]